MKPTLFLLLILLTSALPAQVVQQDSLALVAFYHAANGNNWHVSFKENWLQPGKKVSQWAGVYITGNRVTELVITVNTGASGTAGNIFRSIQNLTALTRFYIGPNQISGPIPPEIGNLVALRSLILKENQLTGSIPPEIGNLTELRTLDLSENQLSGSIPSQIGNLVNLTHISLSINQLSGSLPATIGNMTALTNMQIGENQLTGPIPVEIGNMQQLGVLFLNKNQLSGNIPTEIGDLQRIEALDLGRNQLTGPIPSEIGNLTTLIQLVLGSNQLTGTIPPSIGNLINLTRLELQGNQLTGTLPAQLGNLSQLTTLLISDNQLTSPIPSQLGLLTELQILNISNNLFAEPIPDFFTDFTKLNTIYIDGNQFSGQIPPGLFTLADLNWVGMSDNQLTGELPAMLSPSVSIINVINNRLSGEIPAAYFDQPSMNALGFENNLFTGASLPATRQGRLQIVLLAENLLEFDDLELLYQGNIASVAFLYSPQTTKLYTSDELTLHHNAKLTIKSQARGTANLYQWLKNGTPISNATSHQYEKILTTQDAGIYSAEVSNSIVPGITLPRNPITLHVVDQQLLNCSDASLTLEAQVADPAATFVWSTGATTKSITVNTTGKFGVRIETQNYVALDTFQVVLPSLLSLGNDIETCVASVNLSPNMAASTYAWTLPDGSTSAKQSVTATKSGTYTLIYTQTGCTSPFTTSVNVEVNKLTVGDFTITGTALDDCEGYYDFNTPLTFANTSTAGNNFTWSIDGFTFSGRSIRYSFSEEGDYTVSLTGKDGRNCPIDVEKQIHLLPALSMEDEISSCARSVEISASMEATNYEWQTPWGETKHGKSIVATANGDYILSVAQGGCTQQETISVIVGLSEPGSFTVTSGNVILEDGASALLNTPISFQNTSAGGSDYTWSFGDQSIAAGDAVEHTYLRPGAYIIKLTGKGDNNCPVEAEHQITIQDLVIMTAISPNGDGKNDVWQVTPMPHGAELKMIDRNGRTVYTAAPYNNDFSGQGLEEGVYFFDLYIKETDKHYHGHVSIVK